jgi:tellurite methyltransferase
MKKFADLLSVKRKARGLTQDQLADLVGVSHQAVSKWERAEALPEISKIGDIALAIETPAEELINTLYESQPSTAPTTNSSADEAYFALIDKTRVGEIYALAPNMSKETLAIAIDAVIAEKGTEAAAVTIAVAGALSMRPPKTEVITFDRPFIYAIIKDNSNEVLFAGKVGNPIEK